MFEPGRKVRCIILDDEIADGQHSRSLACLNKHDIYTVAEYNTPGDCAWYVPEEKFWKTNGGRMTLQEMPKLQFFGKRFEEIVYHEG